MLDFLVIGTKSPKQGIIEIYPRFIVKKSDDLMIRGGDFYAVWIEEQQRWSTDEHDALAVIDKMLAVYYEENKDKLVGIVKIAYLWDAETGSIDAWHKYVQKQCRDNFTMLDENLIFLNDEPNKKDYASKRLSYPLEYGNIANYDKIISTLYDPAERLKIEWAIGAIISGDSKYIQKFMVLYGSAGTGKSTIINIIEKLFDGYFSVFDAKSLGSATNSFALEAFKTNPLVSIQHDGDLSKIEDNTRLNSLVSHELMTVNEKYRSTYSNRFKSFLIMGTNKPVKITDAKSGLIRRLIDVQPSGRKLPVDEYNIAISNIPFELGGIAYHCLNVYDQNKTVFDNYIPTSMIGATNDMYNFVSDSYSSFSKTGNVTLKMAWDMYKVYCDDAKVAYPYPQRAFKEELKNYFREYHERYTVEGIGRVRNYYIGFVLEKFDLEDPIEIKTTFDVKFLDLKKQPSIFDDVARDCRAQFATDLGIPANRWEKVTTTLKDLDTSVLHYVQVEPNHIVIDFDIKDSTGQKSLEKNIKRALEFPETYAEVSKGGSGLHLHYYYNGDISKLSSLFDENIEIKIQKGNAALRRRLSLCNDKKIATISSGLPLKGDDKLISQQTLKSEKSLRLLIKRNLLKEIMPGTKPSIDFIHKILEDAYASDLRYDVSDMYNSILQFAMGSTNNSAYCMDKVLEMKFKSELENDNLTLETGQSWLDDDISNLVFFDVECFKNYFLVCYKFRGKGKPVYELENPTQEQIAELFKYKLLGYNNRAYDNHMIYAAYLGYNNEQLYELSQRLISNDKTAKFREAFSISYTDVFDYLREKIRLKEWQIRLGISHMELGHPWTEPVPDELKPKVREYCSNDVISLEAVFDANPGDFAARQILADLSGLSVNDTTNTLTTRLIFGDNRKPQSSFNYRNMGDESQIVKTYFDDKYTAFDAQGRPIFPGYKFEYGKSYYRGELVGEGGYVYAEPWVHILIALLDVASMHPSSIIAEELFGEYTKIFADIVHGRLHIKHKDIDKASSVLGGRLARYLGRPELFKAIEGALKLAINSVYGLTSAKFDNPFKDPRNVDNIVAKRGALFMINLKHMVQERGFTVAHIKTDSIKIPGMTDELKEFIFEYGKLYGYTFEFEAEYLRMCLVNDAVYIAKYSDHEINGNNANTWTATGTEFQVPYIFKTLFSNEPIEFRDLTVSKSVKSSIYLDFNEDLINSLKHDPEELEKELKKLQTSVSKNPNNLSKYIDRITEIENLLPLLHNYSFVGKTGSFVPIKSGYSGGTMFRLQDDKYYAVSGTKGYRWLESEMVQETNNFDIIDVSYFDTMAEEAKKSISQWCNFEWFVSDEPYDEKKAALIPF